MTRSNDAFAAALRAEIDAVVTRYQALALAQHETLSAAREHETAQLRAEITALQAELDRSRAAQADLTSRASQAVARVDQLSAELTHAREATERERRAATEAVARVEAQAAAERQRADRLAAELEAARQAATSLGQAFAAERSFVEAALTLDGGPLLESLRAATGLDLALTPAVFADLKARRPDVVLTQAIKDRGRSAAFAPLSERERAALRRLADAADCELITPEHGQKFSAQSMEKTTTVSDPAEEGNVVECLVPGLRRVGTDGALVFPRVSVATG